MPVVRNDHLRSKGHELSEESPWDSNLGLQSLSFVFILHCGSEQNHRLVDKF